MSTANSPLTSDTLALIEKLITSHGVFTGVRRDQQELFVKTFKSALKDIAGPHWKDTKDKEEISKYFIEAKRLVKVQIKDKIDKSTWQSYCSVTKKMLHYEIDDWKTCKDYSENVLEAAIKSAAQGRNKDNTFFDEKLTYQEAVIRQAKCIHKEREDEKEAERARLGFTDIDFKVPSISGRTEDEWRNEFLLFIRRVLTTPKVEKLLQSKDYQSKAIKDMLTISNKNLAEPIQKRQTG